ncbi:MAG: hypothetical protein ACKOS8_10635, partial [Gemmataceae bacterium]
PTIRFRIFIRQLLTKQRATPARAYDLRPIPEPGSGSPTPHRLTIIGEPEHSGNGAGKTIWEKAFYKPFPAMTSYFAQHPVQEAGPHEFP